MTEEKKSTWSFRMKQLPKPEYALMKAIKDQFQLDDPSEVFVVTLRMLYEVLYHGHDNEGQEWVRQVIDTWRANKTEQRTYELPDMTQRTQ